MALKDLVADKSAIAEEAIEDVITDHIHYYVEQGEVGFQPDSNSLSNDQKVLLYLTAIQGWKYVTDTPPNISTSPSDLSDALSISGGTLRPVLKKLKDNQLITSNKGQYVIRVGNLKAISSIVKGEEKPKAKSAGLQKKKTAAKSDKSKAPKILSNDIKPKLAEFIEQGLFQSGCTIGDVREHFHEKGIIVKSTSLSGPLLRAVKRGFLTRKKVKTDGKEAWVYSSPSK